MQLPPPDVLDAEPQVGGPVEAAGQHEAPARRIRTGPQHDARLHPGERIDSGGILDREGDLVVIFGDNISRCWKQVAGFKSDEDAAPDTTVGKLAVSFVESDPDAFSLDAEAELIRDERGVRIARMDEESD